MTQIKSSQILNNNLTGASLHNDLGLYDETNNYVVSDVVSWQNKKYEALNGITGTIEGDLTQSPNLTGIDWKELVDDTSLYSVYPSASQSFTNTRVTVNFNTERKTDSNFSIAAGELTFLADDDYVISVTSTINLSVGSGRSGSRTFVQLDTGGGYVDIPNILISGYHRSTTTGEDTGSITFPLTVTANDKIRIQTIRQSGSDTLITMPEGFNITILNNKGSKGDRGLQGFTGSDGDITWEGVWSAGTYNTNEAVEYQGSSYVCVTNGTTNNPGTPSSVNAGWNLFTQKGSDGSGTSVNINDSGAGIPNTPHTSLDFTGDITASDGGGGVATINYVTPKNTYMIPIWAEENAALGTGSYEWAYGNGASSGNAAGVTIHVPSGYTCEVTAMSLRIAGGTATVELVKNGTLQGSNCDVTISSGQGNTNNISPAISFADGDYLNFYTTTAAGTSGPCVVTAWLTYTEI